MKIKFPPQKKVIPFDEVPMGATFNAVQNGQNHLYLKCSITGKHDMIVANAIELTDADVSDDCGCIFDKNIECTIVNGTFVIED